MRQRTFGKGREILLGAVLPIAAMDEQQRRRPVAHFQKVDAVTLARAITEIEMGGMPLAQLRRTRLPFRDDGGAAGNRLAIVEAAVERLPAKLAPVRRVQSRHSRAPHLRCQPAAKCSTALPKKRT